MTPRAYIILYNVYVRTYVQYVCRYVQCMYTYSCITASCAALRASLSVSCKACVRAPLTCPSLLSAVCPYLCTYVAWSRGGCGGTGLLPDQPLVPTPHLGLWVPGQCEAGAATAHSVGESSQGQASRRRRGNQVQVRCLTSDQQVKGMCVWESMYVRSLVNQTPLIHRPFICNVTDDITVINGRWKGTSGSQD